MFKDIIDYPIEHPKLVWEARLVLRDIKEIPHLFLRVKLSGTFFPVSVKTPWVRAGRLGTHFVEFTNQGLSVNAYFDRLIPFESKFEFGFHSQALLRFPEPFSKKDIIYLAKEKLPKGTKNIEHFY